MAASLFRYERISNLVEYPAKKVLLEVPGLVARSALAFVGGTQVLYYSTNSTPEASVDFTRIVAVNLKSRKLVGSLALKDLGHNWDAEEEGRKLPRSGQILMMYLTGDGYLLTFGGSDAHYM